MHMLEHVQIKHIDSEAFWRVYPPPNTTARLGKSSKLNASSEVMASSYRIKQ
jgi:hypothetical protein